MHELGNRTTLLTTLEKRYVCDKTDSVIFIHGAYGSERFDETGRIICGLMLFDSSLVGGLEVGDIQV